MNINNNYNSSPLSIKQKTFEEIINEFGLESSKLIGFIENINKNNNKMMNNNKISQQIFLNFYSNPQIFYTILLTLEKKYKEENDYRTMYIEDILLFLFGYYDEMENIKFQIYNEEYDDLLDNASEILMNNKNEMIIPYSLYEFQRDILNIYKNEILTKNQFQNNENLINKIKICLDKLNNSNNDINDFKSFEFSLNFLMEKTCVDEYRKLTLLLYSFNKRNNKYITLMFLEFLSKKLNYFNYDEKISENDFESINIGKMLEQLSQFILAFENIYKDDINNKVIKLKDNWNIEIENIENNSTNDSKKQSKEDLYAVDYDNKNNNNQQKFEENNIKNNFKFNNEEKINSNVIKINKEKNKHKKNNNYNNENENNIYLNNLSNNNVSENNLNSNVNNSLSINNSNIFNSNEYLLKIENLKKKFDNLYKENEKINESFNELKSEFSNL